MSRPGVSKLVLEPKVGAKRPRSSFTPVSTSFSQAILNQPAVPIFSRYQPRDPLMRAQIQPDTLTEYARRTYGFLLYFNRKNSKHLQLSVKEAIYIPLSQIISIYSLLSLSMFLLYSSS